MTMQSERILLPAQSSAAAASHLSTRLLQILLGSWVIAISAWIEVPMIPVPMTMQTFALLLVAASCGFRLSTEILAAYLFQGAVGLPVFAGGTGGLQHLTGPTGSYRIGFLFAAMFIGWFFDSGSYKSNLSAFIIPLTGHLIVFVPGVLWLSTFVGFQKALASGFDPFILGTVLKTTLAMAVIVACTRQKASSNSSKSQ